MMMRDNRLLSEELEITSAVVGMDWGNHEEQGLLTKHSWLMEDLLSSPVGGEFQIPVLTSFVSRMHGAFELRS